jgi:hypothetical protein
VGTRPRARSRGRTQRCGATEGVGLALLQVRNGCVVLCELCGLVVVGVESGKCVTRVGWAVFQFAKRMPVYVAVVMWYPVLMFSFVDTCTGFVSAVWCGSSVIVSAMYYAHERMQSMSDVLIDVVYRLRAVFRRTGQH